MFNGAGVESICCGSKDGYAVQGGAGANLAPVRAATGEPSGRTVAFPMVDPYGPVRKTRVPVPGYNAWPGRANRLGRTYYGLNGTPQRAQRQRQYARKARGGFAGMGLLFDPIGVAIEKEIGPPPVYSPTPKPVSNGINWDTFFGGLFKTLPGTISAVTGRGDPLLRTQGVQLPAYPQYGNAPDGYSYNSSGQLVKDAASNITDFITENPLLVGGAILGAVLLFMRPPGRR